MLCAPAKGKLSRKLSPGIGKLSNYVDTCPLPSKRTKSAFALINRSSIDHHSSLLDTSLTYMIMEGCFHQQVWPNIDETTQIAKNTDRECPRTSFVSEQNKTVGCSTSSQRACTVHTVQALTI
jgi:hypothetical protein